jgi:hypothetical protein
MLKYGYARRIPEWLKPLKKGLYTISEICEITGYKYNNVYKRLRYFEVEPCLVKVEDKKVIKYKWEGHQFYTEKFNKEKK